MKVLDELPFAEQLRDDLQELPAQLQTAARWMLDHPADVALLTTREQARRAGVMPATMTRLAKRMGFPGYDNVRRKYAERVRQKPESFTGRAEELIARRDLEGDAALLRDIFVALSQHLQRLSTSDSIAQFTAAADLIASAERVYCWGLRSSFPVAYLFHYVRSLFGEDSVLVDGAGSIGIDYLRKIGTRDIFLAVTANPYTRSTLEAARYAKARGASVIAITDSEIAPIATVAGHVLLVGTETPSFLHTMTPAFAAVETLAALVAARRGSEALAALAASEDQLATFETYLHAKRRKRSAK